MARLIPLRQNGPRDNQLLWTGLRAASSNLVVSVPARPQSVIRYTAMKPPAEDANVDIHGEVRALLEAWCDRRVYQAICLLYGGYHSINGLTDGWADFLKALQLVRNLARQENSGISELK